MRRKLSSPSTHEPRRARSGAGQKVALFAFVLGTTLAVPPRNTKAEDIDTQRFAPHATSGGFLQTEGTEVRYPVDPLSLGAWLTYGHNPLVRVDQDHVRERIVGTQLGLDLTASYAFSTWFELGAHLPLGYLAGDDLSTAAVGDLRLLPKFRLLDDRRQAVGLAILADTRLPSHSNRFYGGARLPAFAPRLLLDHRFGLSGFRAGIDVGVLIRKETEYRNVSAGSEILAGIGLGYRFDGGRGPVELMLDLRNAIGLVQTDSEEVALEALLGVEVDVTPEWKLHAGGGVGLLEGFGVPTGRALLGVRWEPSPNDPDHDGVRSQKRANDDQTRATEAGADEPQQVAEDSSAESVDAVDDAAREAAIRGGYDACPDLPEDYDGVEDEDGCPEGDQDGDGVLDYLDRCPGEAETINGFEDDDGCKDEGPAQIIVEEGRITILETIRFEPNSVKLERSSSGILDQITLIMRKNEHIKRIEIGGHTDSTGSRELNMRLSRGRARTVRQYLIARGIAPSRLSARGYGPDTPVADNASDEGRTQNRRVEFLVR
jgi:OOP family OmpA-OmpF porin